MAKTIKRSIYWGMSEEAIRERVVGIALGLLGIREGTKEFEEKIRAVYNAQKPLPRGHALSKTDAWCAAFVTVVGILAEISDIILPECSCSRMIALYKAKGQWEERDDYNPKLGDIIMYDWQDDGRGDCTGAPDHTGIAVGIEGDALEIAEGNFENMSQIRTVRRDQIHIRGWCLPDYARLVHGYQDVPEDAWYREAVQWADGRGITEGIGDHDFAPELGCTRAQIVTMLWRLAGRPDAGKGHPFGDVDDGAYYADAVRWAAQEGITDGIAEGYFSPDSFCTRAQIFTMVWRWQGRPQAENAAHPFTDVDGESFYSDAVEWAWCEGVTVGVSGREFEPFRTCNRAQAVTVLWRLDQYV